MATKVKDVVDPELSCALNAVEGMGDGRGGG
jgi:hypothetical protein